MAQLVKTVAGLAIASVKTVDQLAIASIKTIDGLDNTAGGAQAFNDNFTRANANPMSTAASGGGTWVSGPGALIDMQINANNLEGTGAFSGCAVATADSAAAWTQADYTVTGTIGVISALNIGLYCRLQSASGSGYLLYLDDALTLDLYKVTDTGTLAFASLGTRTITAVIVGDTLGLKCAGGVFTIYKNGAAQGATISDSTYATGVPGAYSGLNGTLSWSAYNAQ